VSTEAITIYVPALPVAQPRPTVSTQGGFARAYTKAESPVHAFKAAVAMAAHGAYQGAPLTGPLWLEIECVFKRPKGKIWKTKPMPRERHWKRPDRDNVEKAVMDSLGGILWNDDAQVCDGPITKWIASGDEQPHVLLTLKQL
jgi:Holliday junction resolvase RusA-like endonuclease